MWWLYHRTWYQILVSPLYRWLLTWSRIPRKLKWIVAPAIARQDPERMFPIRRLHLSGKQHPIVRQVAVQGYADVTDLFKLNFKHCESVRMHFAFREGYAGQVPIQSDMTPTPLNALKQASYISFDPALSLANADIVALAHSVKLKSIADAYLNRYAHLYSVNTMLTLPNSPPHGVTQLHRDYDDLLSLTCFVYWTDTTRDNGATYYIPGSHIGHGEQGVYLEGKAGSVFLVDTYGLHAGNPNVTSPRLVTWFRFGEIPNLAYVCDKNYLFFH